MLVKRILSKLIIAIVVFSILPIANAEEIELKYDANGNLIQDKNFYYEYNSLNQLVQIREKNSQGRILAKYTYDYNGNRILKELFDAQGKSKTVYYPDENFVREIDERTKAVNDIVYYYDSDLVAKKENNKLSFYHQDHLGSTSVVTDEQGKIIENNHYLPFGEILEGGDDRYLYTSQELDPESQLYYYGARYYSPYLAKFTQPDTIIQDVYNPQNLNRYSYVLNNPYKYNDPSGNLFWDIIDGGLFATDLKKAIDDPSLGNIGWAVLSGVSLAPLLPNVAGYIRYSDKAIDAVKGINKVIDAGKALDKGKDAVRATDKAVDAVKATDKAGNLRKVEWINPKELHISQGPNDFTEKRLKNAENILKNGWDPSKPALYIRKGDNKILVEGQHKALISFESNINKIPAVDVTKTGPYGYYPDLGRPRTYAEAVKDAEYYSKFYGRKLK